MATALDILLEDGPLLAVNKPAGLLTQGPPGAPSLEAAVKAHLKAKHGKPGNVYLGVPHRLDRPVSGVVVFARNSKAAARLAEQFSRREVKKTYWAIVEGWLPEDAGRLCDFLRKLPDEARAVTADPADPHAREAVLTYRVLHRMEWAGAPNRATFVEIEPVTGRMHQIRVQFASRGYPVLGDAKYGACAGWDKSGQPQTNERPCFEGVAFLPRLVEEPDIHKERIALHARELWLRHPIRYDEVRLIAPPPQSWREFAVSAGILHHLPPSRAAVP